MHRIPCAALLAALSSLSLPAQGSQHISLLSHVGFPPCTTGDVWGLGLDYMLVARRSQGFSVIDVRDPANPQVATIAPPGYPQAATWSNYGVGDIKADGRYIYATNENRASGVNGGVFIYDTVPNPMNPTLVTHFRPAELRGGVHNCWVEGDTLYCISNGSRLIEVYDIRNRAAPVHIASLGQGFSNSSPHDVMVAGNRAYCSLWGAGFAIYDVTNPAQPVLLAHHTYPQSATHNAWPTDDHRYLYTTDENLVNGVGGAVRIWDIGNLSNITQVGTYKAGARDSIVHNVHVVDQMLFVSYYKEGVRVCSIAADPTNPVEIAYYDTFPAGQTPCFALPQYAGCWGIYPFHPGLMLVTDLDNGAYVLRFEPVTHAFAATPNPVTGGQTLQLSLTYTNATLGQLDGLGAIVVTAFAGIPIFSPLVIDVRSLAVGQSAMVGRSLPVPPGLPPGLTVEFTAMSGTVAPSTIGPRTAIPVILQ